jgi:diguanylate cyclase (GGDEF)-like protein
VTDLDRSQLVVQASVDSGSRRHALTIPGRNGSGGPAHVTSAADGLLLEVLTLLNESDDLDATMRQCLASVIMVLDARLGEIWLRTGDARDVQLEYTASDGSPGVPAFEASGRSLGLGTGPALVSRVVKSGRGSIAASSVDDWGGRASEASGARLQGAMTFPIRGDTGVIGVLAIFRETLGRPPAETLHAVSSVCRHIGRFLERVHAEHTLRGAVLELSALASTDSLTGLKNRREFDRALRTVPRLPFAVLSLDVDRLKEINDAEGHAAGDALLRVVGHTLGLLIRGWDVMARVGGDEFAALLPEVGAFGANLVAERMRAAMHTLVLPTGPARIAVGWSAAPAGADPLSVWKRADEALYRAKRAGGDQVAGGSYESDESGDTVQHSYAEVVSRVLNGGRLSTMFQPIVGLADGTVIGYEALARPEGFAAMDSVEAVFESARMSGQIRNLDWVCRRRAVEDARRLPPDATLFLNISAAALLDQVHGVDQLLLLLRAAGRPPHTVVLEITEHERIRDYEELARILATYRAEGVRFALDDVGEGHATLELLAASASEYLKLGRSLTMTSSRMGSRAAMDATLAFARVSGAMVIAEGIESEAVADLMRAAGIALGQGYGLGRPAVASDIALSAIEHSALVGAPAPRQAHGRS